MKVDRKAVWSVVLMVEWKVVVRASMRVGWMAVHLVGMWAGWWAPPTAASRAASKERRTADQWVCSMVDWMVDSTGPPLVGWWVGWLAGLRVASLVQLTAG